jgi:hypothetical protein
MHESSSHTLVPRTTVPSHPSNHSLACTAQSLGRSVYSAWAGLRSASGAPTRTHTSYSCAHARIDMESLAFWDTTQRISLNDQGVLMVLYFICTTLGLGPGLHRTNSPSVRSWTLPSHRTSSSSGACPPPLPIMCPSPRCLCALVCSCVLLRDRVPPLRVAKYLLYKSRTWDFRYPVQRITRCVVRECVRVYMCVQMCVCAFVHVCACVRACA